jgi:hypothetical protein
MGKEIKYIFLLIGISVHKTRANDPKPQKTFAVNKIIRIFC